MVCFGELDLLLGDLGFSVGLDGELDDDLNEMTGDSGVLGSASPGFLAEVLEIAMTGVSDFGVPALGLSALGVEGLFTLGVTDFGLRALGVDFFGLMGLDATVLGLLEAGLGLFTNT